MTLPPQEVFLGSPAWYAHALPQDETGEGLKLSLEQSLSVHGLSHAHFPVAKLQTPFKEQPILEVHGPGAGGVGGGVGLGTGGGDGPAKDPLT